MRVNSIKYKDIFQIKDNYLEECFGSNQVWYERRWQRMSGCGPSAVANMMYYFSQRQNDKLRNDKEQVRNEIEQLKTEEELSIFHESKFLTKKECLSLMKEIWNYVTPSLGGISSTDKLCKGFYKYLKYKNIQLTLDCLDIPKKRSERPEIIKVIEFIKNALEMDSPVAFLNLQNGKVKDLESWHWVTIISMEYEMEEDTAIVEILDGGKRKNIDLWMWFHNTKKGGGFVRFVL